MMCCNNNVDNVKFKTADQIRLNYDGSVSDLALDPLVQKSGSTIAYYKGGLQDMSSIVKYEHHGVEVFADSETKGKHQSVCLCYKGCKRFNPGHADNCEIAQNIFENCKKYNVTTPVFECPKYLS